MSTAHAQEVVDLADLDTLDDTRRHGSCDRCQPLPSLGEVFTAWCGRRAIWLGPTLGEHRWDTPPDACQDCASLECCAVGGHPAYGAAS